MNPSREAWRIAMTDLALCKTRLAVANSAEAIRQCETALEIARLNVRVAAREYMHEVGQSSGSSADAACSNAARLSSERPSSGSGGVE